MAVKEPTNSKELNSQIKDAIYALKQWIAAADISNAEHSVMIDAQIYWLEELLKSSNVELKDS